MTVYLPRDAQQARKRVRVGVAIRPRRSVQVLYRDALLQQVRLLVLATDTVAQALTAGGERAASFALIARQMQRTGRTLDALAPQIAGTWGSASNAANKQQVERMIARALGVEWARVVSSSAIGAAVNSAVTANVGLIRTLADNHWSRVIEAVTGNYQGKVFAEGSLTQRLARIGRISQGQARLIARDQTAKLASDLNAIRQQDAGIQRYRWRNVQDQRVVGNPVGLYPEGNEAHGDHWGREGEEYRWDSPPEDGHPGQAILCRCAAEPVIDLDELDATYV